MLQFNESQKLYEEAKLYTPGGVHTSIRNLEPHLILKKGEGAYIWDADEIGRAHV